MNHNSNLIARLTLNQLPGLAGALQPAGAAPQGLNELARLQHSQNLANAMLSAASGLLTPSPNRYPPAPLQRLGAGLGAALQSYNRGTPQGRILEALGMDGRAEQPRASAGAAARPGRDAPGRAPARKAPAPVHGAAAGAQALGRTGVLSSRALRKPASRQLKLEDFSGTLASRLDHPAVLPGGWKLCGYDQEGGRPVYVGPGRKLRVYG